MDVLTIIAIIGLTVAIGAIIIATLTLLQVRRHGTARHVVASEATQE